MGLTAGQRLGAYEVIGSLGAGGMGEVYRARDTVLGREVAVKVVSDSFIADPERLARFEREAQILASLNHPHIATVHGLERCQGTQFLVMELIEGETLAERLADGALPLSEALRLATEIAEALNAAHEKGVIHRDLKPANIALTGDGHVKVLDFGLAKALPSAAADSAANSPTLTLAATQAGVILGTAAYMAPEQAKGRPADKRSDIWAFGCVLYEMLTGQRAFEGNDVSDTMAAVLRGEPDWRVLPVATSPAIRTLVQRCLTKDGQRRLGDISTAVFLLTESASLTAPVADALGAPAAPWRRWRWLVAPLAASIITGGVTAGWLMVARRPSSPPRVSRFAITAPQDASMLLSGNDRDLAISPDGQRIAYIGANGTIYIRSIDRLELAALQGLGSPRGLFFSPDGLWIGYGDGGTAALTKVAVTGGPPIAIAALKGNPRGAVWLDDGTIVFATDDRATGLMRVADGGGIPTVLTRPDLARGETDHWWPQPAADAGHVIFTVRPQTGTVDASEIAVLDLATNQYRTLVRSGTDGRQLPTGHLVYASAGSVRAVHVDLTRTEATRSPTTVLPQVAMSQYGSADLDIARDGTAVYAPGGALTQRTLVWVDRQGREEAIAAPPRAYLYLRMSPDLTRVAIDVRDQESDIWIWNLAGATLTRVTFGAATDRFPVWSHDARRVFFASDRAGGANVFVQAADGTGNVERLTDSKTQQVPMSATPDGKAIVVRDATELQDLLLVPLEGDRQPRPLVKTPFTEQNAEVSPDGRWMAYESNESNRFEVFVRPFPNVEDGKWQVSTGGGMQPAWSRDGRELFYLGADEALMGVKVESKTAWSAVAPSKVVEPGYYHGVGPGGGTGRTYEVSADGRRFLMIKQGADGTSGLAPLVVVQNWFEELHKLVPGK